jgi:hypothetical protein
MSTSIDTVRTDRVGASADGEPAGAGPVARRIVDVSELAPEEIRRYAREADCGIHFERKGGRTFLVAG